jgi:hypothetical protein
VERWAELRREHFVRGVSIKESMRRTGLVRNTVPAALRSDVPPTFRCPERLSKLDPFKEEIHELRRGDVSSLPSSPNKSAKTSLAQVGHLPRPTKLKDEPLVSGWSWLLVRAAPVLLERHARDGDPERNRAGEQRKRERPESPGTHPAGMEQRGTAEDPRHQREERPRARLERYERDLPRALGRPDPQTHRSVDRAPSGQLNRRGARPDQAQAERPASPHPGVERRADGPQPLRHDHPTACQPPAATGVADDHRERSGRPYGRRPDPHPTERSPVPDRALARALPIGELRDLPPGRDVERERACRVGP